MPTVTLSGKAELDIYINPQRQRLLRVLTLAGQPMTPKQLADALGISASAVQHHIGKLLSLGVVALDHTARVRGITAHYYTAPPVTVRIGCEQQDGLAPERLSLVHNGVNAVLNGYAAYVSHGATPATGQTPQGDALWGILRLPAPQAAELLGLIRAFLAEHDAPAQAGDPWEYALIAYPAREADHA